MMWTDPKEDPFEKEMANPLCSLFWEIPSGFSELIRSSPMGSQKMTHQNLPRLSGLLKIGSMYEDCETFFGANK